MREVQYMIHVQSNASINGGMYNSNDILTIRHLV